MIRNIDRLTGRTFDLLVVGGGIYGLTIAADAAGRGLAVALVDRADFGSGSSFNHLRTIHGGLRYLQSLDIGRARESIRERRVLARIAPHAVRPLPFVLPLGSSPLKGPLALRAGFLIDRLLSRDRNDDLPADLHLPAGHVLGPGAARAFCPDLPRDGLAGAAVWYDYTTLEPDRLTLAWAIAADELGATLANYVEAQALIVGKERVEGIRAVDHRSARHLEIAARVTVNATGGHIDGLLAAGQLSTGMPVLKAMNLVTRRAATDPAVGGRLRDGRHLFRVPWMGRATFGTWESPRAITTPDAQATKDEVAVFIDDLNEAFEGLELTPEDVTLVHRGLVPATTDAGRVTLQKHEQLHDHRERDRIDGLISIAGTKYTTARAVAVRVVDRVLVHLGETARASQTDVTPLPGAGPPTHSPVDSSPDVRAHAHSTMEAETERHLVAAYGNRRQEVLDLAAQNPDWRRRLSGTSPVVAAELVHAARHEMVVRLADAVIRRTPLGALGFPGEGVTADAAAIVGQELGWSEERRLDEVADLRGFYTIR